MKRVNLLSIPKENEMAAPETPVNNSQWLLTGEQLKLRQQGTAMHALLKKMGDGELALLEDLQSDARAQWIFNAEHSDSHNEYALTGVLEGEIVHIIIDRTFVDANNRRWIIDYKVTEFFVREDYQAQLEKYAKIMRLQETREIWLGIYSPLSKLWLEWQFC